MRKSAIIYKSKDIDIPTDETYRAYKQPAERSEDA
jgi:hypothetical protein